MQYTRLNESYQFEHCFRIWGQNYIYNRGYKNFTKHFIVGKSLGPNNTGKSTLLPFYFFYIYIFFFTSYFFIQLASNFHFPVLSSIFQPQPLNFKRFSSWLNFFQSHF